MLKKVLSILLACLTLLPMAVLASCGNTPDAPEETTVPETTEPAPQPVAVEIVGGGKTEYKIIRPESKSNDEPQVVAAVKLRRAIESACGVNPDITEDWYKRDTTLPEKAKEILVGMTNRVESQKALSEIREKDFTIRFENDRVVICGGSDDAVARAVDYFIEKYVNAEQKTVTLMDNTLETVKFDYILGDLSVNGVSLRDYRVVYPEGCDKITYYCAVNLADYIKNNAGFDVAVVSDKEAEAQYELLVGLTNRSASAAAAAVNPGDDEYVLCKTGDKVVMYGKSYMSGAAAGVLMNKYFASTGVNAAVDAKDLPASPAAAKFEFPEGKNGILIVGDGMGRNHVQATLDMGKLDVWAGDLLPGQAYCTTYSNSVVKGSASYTDSAAAGTALATGYKTNNGYIAMDTKLKPKQSLRELAFEQGFRSSILTTDAITGATPAVFLAHQKSRNDTEEIQKQIDAVVAEGGVNFCKGSVGDSLYKYTQESLQLISENNSRFFTMIEEAYTDKGGHNNKMDQVNMAVVRLNETVAYSIGFVMLHPDTALLITADHETGGITKKADGSYVFTATSHTNTDVPVYGIGPGVTDFLSKKVDNTEIAKFFAKILGAETFGQ